MNLRTTRLARSGIGLLVLWCCLGTWTASGGGPTPTEYEVKAAYLYNFAKFIDWPAEKLAEGSSPLVIGILGEDPFGNTLDATVKDKAIRNHALKIRRLDAGEDPRGCHILFVGKPQNSELDAIAEKVKDSAVLIVGETNDFLDHGGMIRFFLESDTVRFEINPAPALRARLQISSKLLSVAKVASGGHRP